MILAALGGTLGNNIDTINIFKKSSQTRQTHYY